MYSQRFLPHFFWRKPQLPAGLLGFLCTCVQVSWMFWIQSCCFFFSSGFRGFNAEQNDGRAHILHEIFVNKKLPEDLWEVRFLFCWKRCVCFQIHAELCNLCIWQSFTLMWCKYHFNGVSYVFFYQSRERKKNTYFSPGEAGSIEEFLESEQ